MVMARLHVICGNCGCNEMFSYKIEPKGNCDREGKEYPAVYISCDNCSTLQQSTRHSTRTGPHTAEKGGEIAWQ